MLMRPGATTRNCVTMRHDPMAKPCATMRICNVMQEPAFCFYIVTMCIQCWQLTRLYILLKSSAKLKDFRHGNHTPYINTV